MHEALKEALVTAFDQDILKSRHVRSVTPTITTPLPAAERVPTKRKRRFGKNRRAPSSLINRNITIGSRRTSARLEPMMWDALEEICLREDLSLNALCKSIDECRLASSLTAAIRVYVMAYFRAAATEEGHACIGHGVFYDTQRSLIKGKV